MNSNCDDLKYIFQFNYWKVFSSVNYRIAPEWDTRFFSTTSFRDIQRHSIPGANRNTDALTSKTNSLPEQEQKLLWHGPSVTHRTPIQKQNQPLLGMTPIVVTPIPSWGGFKILVYGNWGRERPRRVKMSTQWREEGQCMFRGWPTTRRWKLRNVMKWNNGLAGEEWSCGGEMELRMWGVLCLSSFTVLSTHPQLISHF